MAVAAPRRRADGDEHRVGLAHRVAASSVVKDSRPARTFLATSSGKPRLEDRHLALPKRRDLVGVLVDAGHDVAEIGEAGARDEPDIAGADHRYTQGASPKARRPAGDAARAASSPRRRCRRRSV